MKQHSIINRYSLILGLAILFYCLDYYFRISPGLVVSQLMRQYQIGPLGMGGFASAFYLGYLVLQVPSGWCLDRFALNRTLVIAIVICTLSYISFVLTHNYIAGYWLRFLTGAASAFSFIGVLYIARHYLPAHWFGFISGLTIAAGTLAASFAQVISSMLMRFFHWHTIFICLALVSIVIAALLLLKPLQLRRREDVLAFEREPFWPVLFQLLSNKRLVVNALIGGLFYLPTTIFAVLWGIPFLQQDYHLDKTAASFGVTMLFVGWAVGSPLIGWAVDRIRYYPWLIVIGAFCGVFVSIALVYFAGTFQHWVFWLLLLFGLCSSAQVIVWKVFKDNCAPRHAGLGASLTNMLIMLFGAVFHLVVGWLLSWGFFKGHADHIDYHIGLSILPIAFAIVALTGALLACQPVDDKRWRDK